MRESIAIPIIDNI